MTKESNYFLNWDLDIGDYWVMGAWALEIKIEHLHSYFFLPIPSWGHGSGPFPCRFY